MKVFLLTLGIACLTIISVGLLVNFCRRRLTRTPHGLSGMCHRTGGEVCRSCAEMTGSARSKENSDKASERVSE